MKSVVTSMLIVGLTATAIYLIMVTRPRLEPVDLPEQVWPVIAIEAQHQTIQPEISLFGDVIAGRRTDLRPSVDGRIVSVSPLLREGGKVSKGDLLLQIDPFTYKADLAEHKSTLKEAEVKLQMLRRDLQRAKELFDAKNVSEQFLDKAELEVLQHEAIVEQRKISVSRAQRNLRDTRLIAPFDGVLGQVNAALGKEYTDQTGEMIAELIDTSRLEVRFSLTNAQYGRFREGTASIIGRPAQVLWKVGDEVAIYSAVIERVGAEIASTTGGVDVFAAIDTGGEQTDMRPGAFVSVRLADKEYVDVLQVPDTALYGTDIIYVVENGRLAERQIKIHSYTGTALVFSSIGEQPIVDGDLIVTTQLRDVGVGAKVEVR